MRQYLQRTYENKGRLMRKKEIIAVTSRKLCTRPFLEQLERVAEWHPKAILLREKDLPEEAYEKLAGEVIALCQSYGTELILHNFPAAAEKLGVKTVHLPLGELQKFQAGQRAAGKECSLKIGCSVHSPAEAKEAERLGAAYLTAGHIYATSCKPGIPPRGLDFLREVCRAATIPVYAIGGIGLEGGRIEEVCAAGAEGACIMSDFMKI